MFSEKTKILIVDDMLTMRKLVKKSLQNMGYSEFVEAVDGDKAWEELNNNKDIGLIISDWNMPNKTGLDFLKLVRGNEEFSSLPFILLTAEAEAHQITEAVSAGVSNYVVKPFTPNGLKDKISIVYKKLNAA